MTDLRLVIITLGVLAVLGLGSCTYLASSDHSIPDVLVSVTSGSVASLGTLLTVGGRRRVKRQR